MCIWGWVGDVWVCVCVGEWVVILGLSVSHYTCHLVAFTLVCSSVYDAM